MAGDANFRIEVDDTVLRQIINSTPDNIRKFLDQEAQGLVNDIVLSFGTSPSVPGEPPGVDTGALRASMDWDRKGTNATHQQRRIHDGVDYGVHLEYGTSNDDGSTRMAARPFMGPAFERERRDLAQHAKDFGLVKP